MHQLVWPSWHLQNHVAVEVIRQLSSMVVIITESYEKAEQLQEDLEGFWGRKAFDCSLSGTPCLMTTFHHTGTCWEKAIDS